MLGQMMDNQLHKMRVTCTSLHYRTGIHPTGDIIEASDVERAELLKDGNAEDAPADSVVSIGTPKVLDPVERDIIEKNYEAVRGAIRAPEGAERISTPLPGPGPAPRDEPGIQPIPGTSSKK
jgi:hypothetical protein